MGLPGPSCDAQGVVLGSAAPRAQIATGDCIEVMASLPEGSFDAIVTDPPYGLEFMGKEWDRLGDVRQVNDPTFHPSDATTPFGKVRHGGTPAYASTGSAAGAAMQAWHERWVREAFRVLKPGGHLIAFGGTRTFHRLTCAIEDAGFEIRDDLAEFWDSSDAARAFLDSLDQDQIELLLRAAPADSVLAWAYGSGFPKSLDVSKAIDKIAGATRTQIVGPKLGHEDFVARTDAHSPGGRSNGWERPWKEDPQAVATSHLQLAPATDAAREWSGFGTALKPAWEPIILARKPLSEPNVASNVLKHGTGALNIDGCRIGQMTQTEIARSGRSTNGAVYGKFEPVDWKTDGREPSGRWPANVALIHSDGCERVGSRRVRADGGTDVHTSPGRVYGGGAGMPLVERRNYADADGMEAVDVWTCAEMCPVRLLDEQTGTLTSGDNNVIRASAKGYQPNALGTESRPAGTPMIAYGDTGGASRFFYTAKASRSERDERVRNAERPMLWSSGTQVPGSFQSPNTHRAARNWHPTVKPIELMRWLCRLVGGKPGSSVILDPFAGSGSTLVAALLEGFTSVGIEREAEYVEIARARIDGVQIGGLW